MFKQNKAECLALDSTFSQAQYLRVEQSRVGSFYTLTHNQGVGVSIDLFAELGLLNV